MFQESNNNNGSAKHAKAIASISLWSHFEMHHRGVDRQSASQSATAKVARPEIVQIVCLPRYFAATSTPKVIFTVAAALLARFPRGTLLLDIIYDQS